MDEVSKFYNDNEFLPCVANLLFVSSRIEAMLLLLIFKLCKVLTVQNENEFCPCFAPIIVSFVSYNYVVVVVVF